jgi:hypothetical protein
LPSNPAVILLHPCFSLVASQLDTVATGLATCPTELISSDEMVENVLQVYPHILITILLYGNSISFFL